MRNQRQEIVNTAIKQIFTSLTEISEEDLLIYCKTLYKPNIRELKIRLKYIIDIMDKSLEINDDVDKPNIEKDLLTVKEAAKALHFSINTIYTYINDGTIKAIRIGMNNNRRIHPDEIEKLKGKKK